MILIIMFGIIIYAASILRYEFLQEDLIFFSLLSKENYIENKVDDNNKDIMFEIGNDKTQVQRIDFCNIIKNKTLINQKIAPGTKGDFNIILKGIEENNYKIMFKSQNDKPLNLQFYTENSGIRYQTLEDLGDELFGKISKNEKKKITINWEWVYEINSENDNIDTKDAKKIRKYIFYIYVQSYNKL